MSTGLLFHSTIANYLCNFMTSEMVPVEDLNQQWMADVVATVSKFLFRLIVVTCDCLYHTKPLHSCHLASFL